MLKPALLARPHTFIVAEMRPLLEESGFSIIKLENFGLLVGVHSANDVAAQLGRQETFLYFSNDDLANPGRRAIAARPIQRHSQ